MRVMFVDDDAKVLKGITRMLDCCDVQWDIETAASGSDALEQLENERVDVLVCDMQMPGMDGAQLLEEVSRRYPDTVRIVLSGQADKASVYRAVSPMHQYLAKPCEADTLQETIARACALRELLDSTKTHDFIGRVSSLPSVPDLYQKVVAEIESEDGTVSRVGELVAQDPAMTAKILQLANSAIFGCRTKITSPAQAASLIGLDALKSLVLSLQVFKSFDGETVRSFSIEALTNHSLYVAGIARQIASIEGLGQATSSESFTAGLLHDVGKLILAANAPAEYASAITASNSQSIPLIEAERAAFGLGHDSVGGYLLALWGLPQSIVEAVAFHHCPDECTGSQLTTSAVVYLANLLAHAGGFPADKEERGRCERLLSQLGLSHRMGDWCSAINESKD